jgi:hypothetical protein
MDDPAEEKWIPKDYSQNELEKGRQRPPLEQLAEPRNKKAAECREDVAAGALTCHVLFLPRLGYFQRKGVFGLAIVTNLGACRQQTKTLALIRYQSQRR